MTSDPHDVLLTLVIRQPFPAIVVTTLDHGMKCGIFTAVGQ